MAGADVYAPPNPNAPDEVYIEPAHAMQYRVGYMVFKQTIPKPDGTRKRRRRKRLGDPKRYNQKRSRDPNSENVLNYPNNSMSADRKRLKTKRPDGSLKIPTTPTRPASASLFRRMDEFRGMRNPMKIAKHPKQPSRKNSGREQRRADTDTNQLAPPWTAEEDWQLLRAVRMFLGYSGALNWALVSDTVNSSTSLTGRMRSRTQCRDRYFREIMPREEGRVEQVAATQKQDPKKKKKLGKANAPGSVPTKLNKKHITTQRLYEMDNKKSVATFHETCFGAVQTAMKMRKNPKPKAFPPNSSFEQVIRSLTQPGQPGQNTAVIISDARVKRLKEKRDKEVLEQKEKQEQRVMARKHSTQQPGANPKVAKARAGTPGSQPAGHQFTNAHRLTLHVIHNYNNEEAKLTAKNIYANRALNERQKVEQLTNIIKKLQAADPRQPKGSLSKPALSPRGTGKGAAATTPLYMSSGTTSRAQYQQQTAQGQVNAHAHLQTVQRRQSIGSMHTVAAVSHVGPIAGQMVRPPSGAIGTSLQHTVHNPQLVRSPALATSRVATSMAAARSPGGINMTGTRLPVQQMTNVRSPTMATARSPMPQTARSPAQMVTTSRIPTTMSQAQSPIPQRVVGSPTPLVGQQRAPMMTTSRPAQLLATTQSPQQTSYRPPATTMAGMVQRTTTSSLLQTNLAPRPLTTTATGIRPGLMTTTPALSTLSTGLSTSLSTSLPTSLAGQLALPISTTGTFAPHTSRFQPKNCSTFFFRFPFNIYIYIYIYIYIEVNLQPGSHAYLPSL